MAAPTWTKEAWVIIDTYHFPSAHIPKKESYYHSKILYITAKKFYNVMIVNSLLVILLHTVVVFKDIVILLTLHLLVLRYSAYPL